MVEKFIGFFSYTQSYVVLLLSTLIASFFGIQYVEKVPKPETFVELIKYFFNDRGSYSTSIILFLLIGIAYILLVVITSYNTYYSWNELSNVWKISITIYTLVLVVAAIYFITYFVLVLVPILLLGLVATFVIWNLDSKR